MTAVKKNALCIMNPAAGKKKALEPVIDAITNALSPEYHLDCYLTKGKGDATRLARENAQHAQLLVCGGGDGTLNEVVTGLQQIKKDLLIHYIPLGTSNAVARTLKIPKNIKKNIKLLKANHTAIHDIGVFNKEKYYNYFAGFGALTAVAYSTPQKYKNKLGFLAYIFHYMKHIKQMEPVHAKVFFDGHMQEGDYIFGSISNTPTIGGGAIRLKEQDVCFDDGQLELLLVETINSKLAFVRIVCNGVFLKKFDRFGVSLHSASNIRIEFEKETAWTVDGEDAGAYQSVEITVKEGALQIITGLPDGRKNKTCAKGTGKAPA
mgnify:CR=1 FL=1